MEMHQQQVLSYAMKLKEVLDICLLPEFKPSDDVYFEKIVSHLSGKHDQELAACLLKLPLYLEWIEKAISLWETTGKVPKPCIFSFYLKLLSLICIEENKFLIIQNEKNIIFRTIQLFKLDALNHTASVKASYIQLQTSISKHNSGICFIRETEIWKDIVNYSLQNHTIYIIRESHRYVYDILCYLAIQRSDENMLTIIDILTYALEALTKKVWKEQNNLMYIEDADLTSSLMPTLNLLNYILEECLKSPVRNIIPRVLLVEFNLLDHLHNLLNVSYSDNLLKAVLKLGILIHFSKIEHDSEYGDYVIEYKSIKLCLIFMLNILNFVSTSRKNALLTLYICEFGVIYWSNLRQRIPDEAIKIMQCQNYQVIHQFIVLQIVPVLIAISPLTGNLDAEQYVIQILQISSEHTTRAAYAYRALIKSMSNLNELAHKSILSLMTLKKYFKRDLAVLVFQALIYSLNSYVPEAWPSNSKTNKPKIKPTDLILTAPDLLGAILHAICTLLQDFRITWKDSIESISILGLSLTLLDNINLTTKLNVLALQVTQLGIEQYMEPNLALLMDKMEGSSIDGLGTLLNKKLNDPNWEVRDSSLELLTSVSTIGFKFPSFQKHILEAGLVSLACIIAKNDTETYVRASAWKCIAAMVKIPLLWTEYLKKQELHVQLMDVITSDHESIVRKEAVVTLTVITNVHDFYSDRIYDTMSNATVKDLDWEVQINALDFWAKAIQWLYTHHGMINGKFPNVTFSSEKKKIVTFDSQEIHSRLEHILQELSRIGCLQVMMECLHEHTDLRVTKEVVNIIRSLINLLTKYNFPLPSYTPSADADIGAGPSCSYTSMSPECSIPLKTKDQQSDIMNSIVDTDDISLLATIYQSKCTVQTSKEDTSEMPKIGVNAFLLCMKTLDFDKIIEERSHWLSSLTEDFGSLLDDILCCHRKQSRVVNIDMDCY